MTKWIAFPATFVAAAALALNVEAAPKTTAKSNSPKTTKTTTTKAPSTSQGSSTKTKGPSPKSTSVKADQGSKSKAPKSSTTTTAKNTGSSNKSNKSTKKTTTSTDTASASTNSTTNSTTTTDTTTTTGTDWKPTNAVAEKLMSKPNQLAKLKAALGDSTIDINDATAGFKNFGQLNAAVNVSQNLGIDFADLKAAMTGITIEGEKTNEPTKSLGQAIKLYRNDVDAEAEATAATTQAIKEGGQ